MSSIPDFLSRLFTSEPGRRAAIPRQLLERAEARAGTDRHEAQSLREAALAYLRVVR
jgi:hypothetical protein